MEAWRKELYLEHSAKGTHWAKKNHKYLKKIGDTYIYNQKELETAKREVNDDLDENGKYTQYDETEAIGENGKSITIKTNQRSSDSLLSDKSHITSFKNPDIAYNTKRVGKIEKAARIVLKYKDMKVEDITGKESNEYENAVDWTRRNQRSKVANNTVGKNAIYVDHR